jgi:hypothetical protein
MSALRDMSCSGARMAVIIAACLGAPMIGTAQSCSAPLPIGASSFTASTCDGTLDMPFISSGTTVNRGPDVVYELDGALSSVGWAGTVTLQPEPDLDLALFVCIGKCSNYATCFQMVDNGPGAVNTASIPGGLPVFVVVAHPAEGSPTCGGYSLQVDYTPPSSAPPASR